MNNLDLVTTKKYPFSILFYISLNSLFFAVSIILLGMLETITGKALEKSEIYSFVIPISIVGATWVLSFIIMLRQKFLIKYSFSISNDGIHNILIGGIVLAFIVVIPIKFIPWKSLKVNDTLLGPRLVVNFKELENLSIIKRFVIRLKGLKLMNLYSKLDEEWIKRLLMDQESKN